MRLMDPQTLEALWAVLTAVRESTGYPDVLFRIAQALATAVPCDRVTVYVRSRRRGMWMPAAEHGTPAAVVEAFARHGYAPGTFPGEEELALGRSIEAVHGRFGPEMDQILDLAQLTVLRVTPLMYQDEAEGVLSCGFETASEFTATQAQLLDQIAPQIALLIRTARLEASHARLAERRTRLARCAAEVLEADDLESMGARLCTASRSLFRATRAALMIVEDGLLVRRATAGVFPPTTPLHVPFDAEPAFREAIESGVPLVLNDVMNTPQGATRLAQLLRPAALLVIPLADAAGPVGCLTVVDVEERYRFGATDADDARLLGTFATVAIRKAILLEALQRANEAKSEFLASVSHDLRTPLNVLLGYTQLLVDGTFGEVGPMQADTLQRMHRTANAQLTLIDDLLDLARIEQGKLGYTLRSVHVGELVGSLREMMDALLRDRPIGFEVDVATDAVARTDRERLRQVLVNLLANAAKFTQAGCVRLVAARAGERVDITVMDTGPGMEPGIASQALEPFVHGDSPAAGSGLGLAIVARLLRLLGGDVVIDSAPGRGTSVRVRLPAS
jgi:signal transduction histidine kinase